jgi:predicted RND superfamily exporter protein
LRPDSTRYARFIVRHPGWVLLFWAVVTLSAGMGLRLLEFNNNHRAFFSPDNPQLLAFNALENTFNKNDTLNFVVQPADGEVFSQASLGMLAELTRKAWQIPYSSRVDSLTNFQFTEGVGDDLVVRDLVPDPAVLDAAALTRLRDTALAEPNLNGALIRESGDVTAVNVVVQLPRKDEAHEVPQVVEAARGLAAEIERNHPGTRIHLTGLVMMDQAFAEASRRDILTLIPASFAVMILLIALLLGGATGALGCVLVIALAIVIAMGLAGYIGYPVSSATSAAPVIILTVAIANCVHILDAYRQALQTGADKETALIDALGTNLRPIFFASLTTVIGFLTFNFSEVPPFRQLGNLVAFGDFASYMLAISLFPALLALLPARFATGRELPVAWVMVLAEFAIKRRRWLLRGLGVLLLGLIACIPRNQLNDVFVNYFDESTAFRQATDFTTRHLSGVYHFYYTLDSGQEGGIHAPAFLAAADAFVAWLRQQPEVKHVTSYTDTVKRLNRNLHAEDPAYYRLPDSRELAAQYQLLYEMSLPYGLDLNSQIDVNKSALKISAAMETLSSQAAIAFNTRAEEWLRIQAPDIASGTGSGTALMFSHLGVRNIKTMLMGSALALALISFLLVFMLRAPGLGLLSLIPNLLPLGAGFGLWALAVGQVGLSLSVVTSMSLGIIIDDTVHFLVKYQRARRRKDLNPEDAIRYAFRVNGRAMLVTSITLVLGFLVLAFSAFELNAGMGLLTALVIGLALLVDLLFLSPLLLTLEERAHAR